VAVLAFATEERPFGAMKKITHCTRDFKKDTNVARLLNMMKKALKTLAGQKKFKAKKDSYVLTPRGKVCAQGDLVHASTVCNPRTSLEMELPLFQKMRLQMRRIQFVFTVSLIRMALTKVIDNPQNIMNPEL
jgi:hypothetical protein